MGSSTLPKPVKLARKPRGFPDKREALIDLEQTIIDKVTAVYRHWGFEGLETGAFEYADALGKFLPDDDRPNAGVFSLYDNDNQWLNLRYDLTAPLARFAAENWQTLAKPFRRYAAGTVYRNEKSGPGRFRAFLQCDADTIGAGGSHADTEMIAMAAAAMRAVGLKEGEFVIRINTRRLLNAVLDGIGVSDDAQQLTILRTLDKLDKVGLSGVVDLLGPGRMDESGDFTAGAGLDMERIQQVIAYLEARQDTHRETLSTLGATVGNSDEAHAGMNEIETIMDMLAAFDTSENDVIFDPSVVRGLDYYTGAVFEASLVTAHNTGNKGNLLHAGSIGGGGRYDDLITRFTGKRVPATGFSVGVSRLATALAAKTGVGRATGPIVVLNMDQQDPEVALKLASVLRAADLRAEAYMGQAGLRAQMKYADRRKAPVVVMAGTQELEKGIVTVKDLRVGTRQAESIKTNQAWHETRPGQFEVPRGEMVARVKEIVQVE